MKAARRGGWLAIVMLGALLAPGGAVEYIPLSPALRTAPVEYLRPVLDEVQKELQQTEKHLTTGAVGIRLLASGVSGTGFLQYAVEGEGLNCLAVVELGPVPVDLDTPGYGAEDLVLRIESYLGAVKRAGTADEGDHWRFLRLEGLDEKGKLSQRERTHEYLVGALRRLADGQPAGLVSVAPDGRKVLAFLGPRQAGLPDAFRAQYLSTQVKYRPEMFPGVRLVTIQFCFLADLQLRSAQKPAPRVVRNAQFLPTVAGAVLRPDEEILRTLFAGQDSATRFVKEVFEPRGQTLEEVRIRCAQQSLEAARRETAHDRRLAALRLLHQSLDSLGPALPAYRRMTLAEHIGAGLRGDAALLAGGTAYEAGVLAEVLGSPDDYAVLYKVGALQGVVDWMSQTNSALQQKYPDFARQEGPRIALALGRLELPAQPSAEQVDQCRAALTEVREAAERLSTLIGPSDYRMRVLAQTLESALEGAGYRRVRLWVLDDGAIGVARPDVAFVGEPFGWSDLEESPLPQGPGLKYRLVDEAQAPAGAEGGLAEPSAVLYLLLGGGSLERRTHDRLMEDLQKADEAFNMPTWTGEKKQIRLPWERKKEEP